MRRKRAQGVKNIPAVSQYHSCYRFPATVRSLISGKTNYDQAATPLALQLLQVEDAGTHAGSERGESQSAGSGNVETFPVENQRREVHL